MNKFLSILCALTVASAVSAKAEEPQTVYIGIPGKLTGIICNTADEAIGVARYVDKYTRWDPQWTGQAVKNYNIGHAEPKSCMLIPLPTLVVIIQEIETQKLDSGKVVAIVHLVLKAPDGNPFDQYAPLPDVRVKMPTPVDYYLLSKNYIRSI